MKFSIDYMRAAAHRPGIRAVKQRSYDLMSLHLGDIVLDIGCGPGLDVLELAKRVDARGRAVGIDQDPNMIAAAQREAAASGVSDRAEFHIGSCLDLPFENGTFGACRCERVLQHMSRSEGVRAVTEALRVLRPGGRAVFVDTDWASLSIHSADPTLERWLASALLGQWRNSFAARGMSELLAYCGASGVSFETFVLPLALSELDIILGPVASRAMATKLLSPWRWAAWRSALARSDAAGLLYSSLNMVLCHGKK